MLSPDEFRSLALTFEGVEERSHMNHPDFRVSGKIFATLGPDLSWGMAKLTPEQQAEFLAAHPSVFEPASGKWGTGGATKIILAHATKETAGEALTLAHQNITAKK